MKYAFLVVPMLVAGCSAEPIGTVVSDNPEIRMHVIAHVDGCTIYRFTDDGYSRYFARCPESETVSSHYACGKGCVHNDSIETVR